MIHPDLVAIIYQRIGLVYKAISDSHAGLIKTRSPEEGQKKLNHITSRTNAFRISVSERIELPHTQFSIMMADVENACLKFESEINTSL